MSSAVTLTPRLRITAQLVRGGGTAIDVGTDHAYLPCFLIQNGIIKSAAACDIAAGPLENAARTVERCGLADRIRLVLSDGLDAISPGCADEVIFAGMGGTLIVSLMKRAQWLHSPDVHLVFQPQSRAEELREYLLQNGFDICRELAVCEGEKPYIAFDASYTGETVGRSRSDFWIGKLPVNGNRAAREHLLRQRHRLENMREGAQRGTLAGYTPEAVDEIIKAIDEVLYA